MSRSPRAGNKGQGSKWIRPEKRLRIYARDNWTCVWCQTEVYQAAKDTHVAEAEDGTPLLEIRRATLDHVIPRSQGGTNDMHNLITCCAECNSQRRERTFLMMAQEAACKGTPLEVLCRLLEQVEKPI